MNYTKLIRDYCKNNSGAIFDVSKLKDTEFAEVQYKTFLKILNKQNEQEIDLILGIGGLIQRLEYGSTIEKAQKANDYGVPYAIVRYYETNDLKIIEKFDKYETVVFDRIKDVL